MAACPFAFFLLDEPEKVGEDEVVAVNSVFELHPLLARPGAIEKVLSAVKEMKPKILTVVEQESNHNGPMFLDRFIESLHYYSTLFDSLEGYEGGVAVVMGMVVGMVGQR
ncbi:hypothetical protein RJ640_029741 [Escallonia rubra]|uniref:DELLA protein n=1 Tax=Escallonia rubra TaxID=112253 RepID=A0AA88U934_9ASTE|nr:hypothetical protein RJ640_029741 [Escallonia rubra]